MMTWFPLLSFHEEMEFTKSDFQNIEFTQINHFRKNKSDFRKAMSAFLEITKDAFIVYEICNISKQEQITLINKFFDHPQHLKKLACYSYRTLVGNEILICTSYWRSMISNTMMLSYATYLSTKPKFHQ